MDDGKELRMHLPVPMQHLIEPVERTIQSAKLAQEEEYETTREDLLPVGLRWRVLHLALGDIGWVELHSTSENDAELALLGTWYKAAVSQAVLTRKRHVAETLLGKVSVLTIADRPGLG